MLTNAGRSTAALVMLVLSLLSAAVVRSNLLALEAAQQAREAEQVTYADVCRRMLAYADVCRRMLTRGAEQRAGGLRVAGVC